jgi:ADP-ribosyl-[dinitrogen reductase] hydrolase
MQSRLNRSKGCLVGLAVGDAVGTTLEFRKRGTFKPITDMTGGGQFCLKKGYWTDDTSMALCLGYSLIECDGFNPQDQMERYCNWLDKGYMSSIGTCFDVGVTVSSALRRFQKTGEPFSGPKSRWTSGNGSIMRLAPIPIYFQHQPDLALHYAGESSRTTHGAPLCIDACKYLSMILVKLLAGATKQAFKNVSYLPECDEFVRIQQGHFVEKPYSEIKGTGFVVESLEAALWCFLNTESFDDCILAAANLGDDADTTAAIAGQLAGAYYGYSAIRKNWLSSLFMEKEMSALASSLAKQAPTEKKLAAYG